MQRHVSVQRYVSVQRQSRSQIASPAALVPGPAGPDEPVTKLSCRRRVFSERGRPPA